MALQFSIAVRNAELNAIVSTVGATPKLIFYTGAPPASCATAASGTVLATLTLPSTWENAASAGSASQASSPWTGSASASGTIGYFRMWDSAVSNCHMQGTVGQGSGDMSFDNPVVATGQQINVNSFTLTAGNA